METASPPPLEVHGRNGQPLGMPTTRFLHEYWQKRPLLVRGAFADFRNPLRPDDLAGLACEELALARIVVHDPREDAWTLRNGPFVEADFAGLPKSHWTLLVQDVDKWDADVAALLAPFAFLPSWRIDDVMVSYAEDGGSVGPHVDQYDVFLLQGLGRRRWQIDTRAPAGRSAREREGACEGFAYRDDTELKLLRAFEPAHEWVLESGDLLYLPPGVPHHGVALDPCMTYSIGMRAPSQADLLGDFADHLIESLVEEARYTDAELDPVRPGGAGEIDDAAIIRVMRAMPWFAFDAASPPAPAGTRQRAVARAPGGISAPALREWFGRFITRYRSAQLAAPPPRALTDATFARLFEAGTRLRRNPWSRVAWMREGTGAILFVAGEAHRCSLALARRLGTASDVEPERVVAAGDRALLRNLVDAGHYTVVRPRRRKAP